MMSDPTNADYYQSSKGTMAGFDSPDLFAGHESITRTGWSVARLRQFLLNQDQDSFPSPERLREIEELITAHLQDFDNPHNVTLEQVIGTITQDIIGNIVPGTTPDAPPFFAYDAACPLPLNNIFPATYSATNMYRRTESGSFVDIASEPEVMGVDSLNADPGLALYSSITNLVPTNWASQNNTAVNTKLTPVVHDSINYPFQFYSVEETNATGAFGVSLPITQTPTALHTLNVFIVPLYAQGSFVVRQVGDTVNFATIDLETQTVEFSSNLISGDVQFYPNNVMHISFAFTTASNPAGRVEILHHRLDDATLVRAGSAGHVLFLVARPTAARCGLGFPTHVNPANPLTLTPFKPQLNRLGAPSTLSNLMVTLGFNIQPLPVAYPLADTVLFAMDELTLVRDNTKVYMRVNNQTVFTSTILPGLNVFSMSYSPTQVMFKDLATAKQKLGGTYPTLNTANVTVGPCAGYLLHMAMYGSQDTDKCLEFLTNA